MKKAIKNILRYLLVFSMIIVIPVGEYYLLNTIYIIHNPLIGILTFFAALFAWAASCAYLIVIVGFYRRKNSTG